MTTISSAAPPVNGALVNPTPATIEEVLSWVESQASNADMGSAGARVRATAIRQMAEQVAQGEPRDARSVLDNLERLADRWARRHQDAKPITVKTYASKAKTTIEEYFRWASAPAKYDPKKRPAKGGRPANGKGESKGRTARMVPQAPPAPPPPPANHTVTNDVSACNLGAGREPFRYVLPVGGFEVKDAIRVAFHLITMCDDYDAGTAGNPIQVFSAAIQRSA
jgi:hypothetical protein